MSFIKYRDKKGAEHVINPYWCQNVEVFQEKGDSPIATISQEALTKYLDEMDDKIITNIEYDKENKRINFYIGDEVSAFIDATDFVKDGMVHKVEVINNVLTITFNADAGREEIRVPLTDIFNPELYYTQVEMDRLVNEIKGQIELANGEIVFIKGRLDIVDSKIANLRDDVNNALDELVNVRQKTATLQQSVDQVNTRMTSLETDVDYTHTQIGQLQEKDKELQAKLDQLVSPDELVNLFDGVEYRKDENRIVFKNGDRVLGFVDTTDFIKDGMIASVAIVGGNLEIKFNTDAGKDAINIPLTDIFNPENYYDKLLIDGKFVEVQGKIDALQAQIDSIKNAADYRDEQINNLKEQVAHDRTDIVEIRSEHDAMRAQVNANTEAIQDLQIVTSHHTAELKHTNDDITDVKNRLDRKVEHTDFNQTVRDLTEKLDQAVADRDAFETDLNNFKAKLSWYEYE